MGGMSMDEYAARRFGLALAVVARQPDGTPIIWRQGRRCMSYWPWQKRCWQLWENGKPERYEYSRLDVALRWLLKGASE
jgi:hypothetical protein